MNLTAILQQARKYPVRSLIFSVLLIVAAVALRIFTPITLSYVTFYPAVILATVAGGWRFGVAAMLISAISGVFIATLVGEGPANDAYSFWNVGAFASVCLLIIWITDLLIDLLMSTRDKADKLDVLYQKLATAEKRQHTLMRELSHRMKNQYAVILAMARAVGMDSTSVTEFQKAFSDRLHSMSRAHDLLTRRDWKAVPLRDLVNSELEAFRQGNRLEAGGDDVWLKEQAVVNIGMALHELATNSSKHGAWSDARGLVTVSWTLAEGNLLFRWQETCGPPAKSSDRRGFGSKILEKIVPSALQGDGALEFAPEGLCWTLNVPAACLDIGEDRH
jgi:two-component sensor histidine kinase